MFVFPLFAYVDMTPCMSPVPHLGPTFGKHGLSLVKEDAEHTGMKKLQGKNGTFIKVIFLGSSVLVHKRSSFNTSNVQHNFRIITA